VLLFTLLVSVLTGVLFGLIPAFNATRADLSATLQGRWLAIGDRPASQIKSGRFSWLQKWRLQLVLLSGAALLIRTFHGHCGTVNPGFERAQCPDHADVSRRSAVRKSRRETAQLVREAERRIGKPAGNRGG